MPVPRARGHRRALRQAAVLLLVLSPVPAALAIDAIALEVREVVAGGVSLSDVGVRIELRADAARPDVRVSAAKVLPGANLPELGALRLHCPAASLDEPRFACEGGRASLGRSPLGALSFPVSLELRTDRSELRARAAAIPLGGGRARIEARQGPKGWHAALALQGATAKRLMPLIASFATPPKGFELDARLDGRLDARGSAAGVELGQASWSLREVNFTNAEGTLVGEKLALQLDALATRRGKRLRVETSLRAAAGQSLAGPVLLNLDANPLELRAEGTWQPDRSLAIETLTIAQKDLLQGRGTALLSFAGGDAPIVRRANLRLERIQLPAAYTSFAQITLAETDFGNLRTAGTLSGELRVEDDAAQSLRLDLAGLDLEDPRHEFAMREMRGTVHWAAAGAPAPPESFLSWREGGMYGLSGGAARIDFVTQGAGLRLTRPTRLPVFDGAIAVRSFSIADFTADKLALEFEGDIEPIGMPKLARAFGWPEFAGQLSGRIPRVELKDDVLTFGGDVEARVFDGRVTGRNIRLQDPLGKWPRLFADVVFENLDLGLVTSTFQVGSITGRLRGSVMGLELFAWSPVAFDAVLETPRGYKGPRRISARAVSELSNIGGGGGGVRAALEGGLFRFFDEYDYERLGLRCKLVNDVCTMSGVEATADGYYILKGRGVPHIDIIGNAGRVNWPQLVSQIGAQIRGEAPAPRIGGVP